MSQQEEAKAAFERIISLGRTGEIRKTAKEYWAAYSEGKTVDDTICANFEKAIKNIPIDYRQPTVKPLEDLNTCKEGSDDSSACYMELAINLVDRITKLA